MDDYDRYTYSLYIFSKGELDRPRHDVEEELETFLGDIVEVSGGGQGAFGWNIDVELLEPEHLEFCIGRIRTFLQRQNVTHDTHIDVIRRETRRVYE